MEILHDILSTVVLRFENWGIPGMIILVILALFIYIKRATDHREEDSLSKAEGKKNAEKNTGLRSQRRSTGCMLTALISIAVLVIGVLRI
ncbi:hypothetical protein [Sinomicrobium oceani]|uniref:hypothetical protein n=1 Tax=Sinomicrobium oceani TaxID=1150368 RepID=UPI00227CEDA6|nr:hypothetical protein [Sinomicrobium oceani]